MTSAINSSNSRSNAITSLFPSIRVEFLSMLRNPASLVPTLLFPVMFWFFFGLPNAQAKSDSGFSIGAYILASFATYSIIQNVLFNLGIFIAVERSSGWYRFLRTTPFRVWVLFSAKMIGVLGLGLIALTLLLTIGALSAGIQLPVTTWLKIVGRALIAMLPFAALAVAIGYLAKGPQSASPIINLIFFPMAFGSGLFIPLDGLPKVVQDIAPFLPAYHAGEFVRRTIGAGQRSSDLENLAWLAGYTVALLALAVWAYKRDEGTNYR
jgi:ABC-2 type transport system permease protein